MKARIGVVGAGWWATQQHIPSLADDERAELAGIADPNPDKRERVARHFGDVPLYEDARAMFEVGGLDGVVVAVPHRYHHEVAAAALVAGLHVLVEKPMTLTSADAWDLVHRAETAGLHLMVGTTFQYTRVARRCHDALRGGEIGELLHVTGYFASMVESFLRGRPEDYRPVFGFPVVGPEESTYADPDIAGGGQGQTQLSHAMGMVLWATGARAVEVSAYMANHGLAVDLVDAIAYRLDNDALGTMGSTGSVPLGLPQQQGFHYYGTEGLVLQDLLSGTLEIHRNDGTSEVCDPLAEDEIYPTRRPARVLVDLVLGATDNPAPGRDAARTVEFIEAAYRSAADHRPVRIAADATAPADAARTRPRS